MKREVISHLLLLASGHVFGGVPSPLRYRESYATVFSPCSRVPPCAIGGHRVTDEKRERAAPPPLSSLMRAIVRLVNGDPPSATWVIFYFHEKFFDWSEIRDFKYHPGARHVRMEIVIDPSVWSRGIFDFHCEPTHSGESNVDAPCVLIHKFTLFSRLSRVFVHRWTPAPSLPANWRTWRPSLLSWMMFGVWPLDYP